MFSLTYMWRVKRRAICLQLFLNFKNKTKNVYNCIVPIGFLPWEIRVALGKASCDRVALPNLGCMLGVVTPSAHRLLIGRMENEEFEGKENTSNLMFLENVLSLT